MRVNNRQRATFKSSDRPPRTISWQDLFRSSLPTCPSAEERAASSVAAETVCWLRALLEAGIAELTFIDLDDNAMITKFVAYRTIGVRL